MAIKVPNLDDRDFEQMVEASLRRVRETCLQWTDLSPHDPGVVKYKVNFAGQEFVAEKEQ